MSVPPESLPDDELILYYYGESRRGAEIRQRLESSPEDRARYDELCRVLGAVDTLHVPEPELRYEERVWNRLRAQIEEERPRAWWKRLADGLAQALAPTRLATAGGVAAVAVAAFLAGRYWPPVPLQTVDEAAVIAAEDRERIVMSVVADHFERSQRLLLELANAPEGVAVDVSLEREGAETLLGANRLYRQTTRHAGQADLAAVLDELERLLLDLAHGPQEIAAGELEDFRSRIEDVLFKVQVLGWRLRQQDLPKNITPPSVPSGGKTGDQV